MILPHLSEFIQTVPVGIQHNGPSQWLEACIQGGLGWVVVVDSAHTPISVLTLQEILSLPGISWFPGAREGERRWAGGGELLEDEGNHLDPWLRDRPVQHWLSWLQPYERALSLIAAAPNEKWVVVDENHRYQGILNTPLLLSRAISLRDARSEDTSAPAPTVADDLPVSRSNTALLTYLGHELKTPLTSLLGLSSLLKSGSLGELTPRQARYVGLIQQHCRRLAVWVNTLIDLGRIDSGSVKIIPQMTELAPLWQEAYHQAALRVGKEDLNPPKTPSLFGYGQSPPALIVDPSRLQQMLSCMMQTALSLQSSLADPDLEFPLFVEIWSGYAAFMLRMPEDALAFHQVSQTIFTPGLMPTLTPPTPLASEMGHWLEWLLVRKLAQLHQGELTLTMHPQQGLCPILLLPVSTTASNVTSNHRLLLLVAPPQAPIVSAVTEQATQLNYRLLVTAHLKDALEISTHLPLSEVLVWVEAPETLGNIQALKTLLIGEDTRVIALIPPKCSSLLGESQADIELLWPTSSLGSVLLQPTMMPPPPSRLTVLYLKSVWPGLLAASSRAGEEHFPGVLHALGCRLLEVDDMEQAELLCRVWKPDVAVLDPAIAHPADYLQTFSQSLELQRLPLITLTLEATQTAHQINALRVFPCLVGDVTWETPEAIDRMTTWLIRVLQTAAMDA